MSGTEETRSRVPRVPLCRHARVPVSCAQEAGGCALVPERGTAKGFSLAPCFNRVTGRGFSPLCGGQRVSGPGRRGAGAQGNPVDGTHRPNMPPGGALAAPGEAENKSRCLKKATLPSGSSLGAPWKCPLRGAVSPGLAVGEQRVLGWLSGNSPPGEGFSRLRWCCSCPGRYLRRV